MSEMSHADAELVYKHLNDRVRGDIEDENICEEIREMQNKTMFSPREFVALVLDSELDEQNAATLMDVSVGNFRGKKGIISDKIEKAEETLERAERIRGE
jgi:hypothetical protein